MNWKKAIGITIIEKNRRNQARGQFFWTREPSPCPGDEGENR